MTRESAKSKIRMSVIVDGKHINSLKKADEVIDKIFDEHEALQQPKRCDGCWYGKTTINSVICGKREHIKKLMITVNTIIQRSNEMTREEAKEVLIIKAGYGDFC